VSSFVKDISTIRLYSACEIPREFELIAGQGHPRSSILLPVESIYLTSY